MSSQHFQFGHYSTFHAKAKKAADGYVNDVFRSDLLSVGVYVLAKGATDDQTPHKEDEVYHVVYGRGRFTVDGKELEVRPGSMFYVPAGVEHRFHDIQEETSILVFWAPPHDE